MKTRVASVVLDTHAQDIDSVADAAESGDSSLASSASSFTTVTYSENIKAYEERTGNSLNKRFGDSSTANSLYRQALSDHMADVDTTIFSEAGRLHKLQAISDELSEYWDKSQLHLPRNNVFWNLESNSIPGGAQNGDIWWDIPGQKNARDFSRAVPRKYKNGQWNEVSFQKEFFGSEIYGGKIQGGKIIGVNFESQTGNGKEEALFHVDSDGKVYAQNFNADILLRDEDSSGHNPRSYRGGFSQSKQGFALENGIFQMKAWANKTKYDNTDFEAQKYYAQTFIEPNGLKQRAYDGEYNGVEDLDSGMLIARTDVRSGRIDINDTFGDDTGFTARPTVTRVGYFDKDKSPDFKKGVVQSYYGDFHKLHVYRDKFICDDIANFHNEITVDGQVSARTLFASADVIGRNNASFDGSLVVSGETNLRGYVEFQNANKVQFNNNVNVWKTLKVDGTVVTPNVVKPSNLSIKKNIENIDSEYALSKLVETDIVKYNYKDMNSNDRINIGPVIDDENKNKKYYLPEDLVDRSMEDGKDTINMDNYVSYLALGIKELAKQNRELMFKVAKLERKE